jgi:hypothetical protein
MNSKPTGAQAFLLILGFLVVSGFLLVAFNMIIIPAWDSTYRASVWTGEDLPDYVFHRTVISNGIFALITILPLGMRVWRILGNKSSLK